MPGITASRPDMTSRDDAMKATGKPSKDGALRAGSPPRERPDGTPDFAALLKAGAGDAKRTADPDPATTSNDRHAPADAAALGDPRDIGTLDRDAHDPAPEIVDAAKAQQGAGTGAGTDWTTSLRDLLAGWSEPVAASAPSDRTIAVATEAAIVAASAPQGSSAPEASPAGDARDQEATRAPAQPTGDLSAPAGTLASEKAAATASRTSTELRFALPGALDAANQKRATAVMPGDGKAIVGLPGAIGGVAPSAPAAPTVLSAHIVDRQTHFAPIETLARGATPRPGKANPSGDPSKAPAVRGAPPPRTTATADPAPVPQHGSADGSGPAEAEPPHRVRAPDSAAATERSPLHGARDKNGGESGPSASTAGSSTTSAAASPTAPALPAATLQRLAGSILSAAGDLAAGQSAAPPPAGTSAPPDRGPVRVLDLELTPADLGLVRVRMRLTSNGIDLQLAATRPATAEYLQEDRHRLSSIIRDAGYDIDGLTVQVSGDGFRSHILPTMRQDATLGQPPAGGSFQPQADAGAQSGNNRGDSPNHRSPQPGIKENDGSQIQEGERSRPGTLYV
ncbi:flagellar hook-length control protein FliK [Amorphus sp. MBR-141]